MATVRHLRNAPISEALVDIRMATDASLDRSALKPLEEELRARFPKIQEKRGFLAEFRVEEGKLGVPSARDMGFQGLRLTSDDGTRVVQFRPDGFTLNNVGAYVGGDPLLKEALEIWGRFAARAHPKTVTRVALRYLNRLELPFREGDDFHRFLVAPPELPVGSPQRVSGFLSRVIAIDEMGASAIITQKLEETTQPQRVPTVIIDIDVFRGGDFGIDSDDLKPILEELRQIKNRAFFSLLTEEAVKMYS
jgi:uncharacterized protein (TIGR04255 family)